MLNSAMYGPIMVNKLECESLPVVWPLPDRHVVNLILVPEDQSQRIVYFPGRRSQKKVSVLWVTVSTFYVSKIAYKVNNKVSNNIQAQ